MFGDLILYIRQFIKEFFCIHDYQTHYTIMGEWSYDKCSKCERVKS